MDNRNLPGFALFTLIIISTIFVKSAFFNAQPVLQSSTVYVETATGTRTNCFPQLNKSLEPVKFEQAVLDLKTKTIDIELDLSKRADFDVSGGANVTLNFFVKGSATRRIPSEGVWTITTVPANNLTKLKMGGDSVLKGFFKKNNLRSDESLYVIPVVTSRKTDAKQLAEFDESEAIPVLIVAEK